MLCLTVTTGQALGSNGSSRYGYTVSKSNYKFWMRDHPAENPNWHQHGTFEGGLGIWYGNWDTWSKHFGLNTLYPSAGDAPPYIQIMVADWAWHNWRDGNGNRPYWGSFRSIGTPS